MVVPSIHWQMWIGLIQLMVIHILIILLRFLQSWFMILESQILHIHTCLQGNFHLIAWTLWWKWQNQSSSRTSSCLRQWWDDEGVKTNQRQKLWWCCEDKKRLVCCVGVTHVEIRYFFWRVCWKTTMPSNQVNPKREVSKTQSLDELSKKSNGKASFSSSSWAGNLMM